MKPKRPIVILLTAIVAAAVLSDAPAAEPLTLAQTITLPGVQGRIDHFGYDSAGKRLFVAALGNDTVEVIDTAAGKVSARIKNLQAPQGIAFAGGLNCLAIANDKDGSVRLFDGQTFEQIRKIDLNDDADNVRYDPATRWFWVGYGNGGLAAIDAQTGKVLADVKLEAHPESFQLESKGKRIFVNVPHTRHIAVIDRDKQAVIAKWPVRESEPTVACITRCTPSVRVPSICGASTTSRAPRTGPPSNPTLLQFRPGSLNGTGFEVCSAMAMKRLPFPSADTAAMLPCRPGGTSWPTTNFAQSLGSNFIPSGSLWGESTLGSIPVLGISVTLKS